MMAVTVTDMTGGAAAAAVQCNSYPFSRVSLLESPRAQRSYRIDTQNIQSHNES